MKAQVTKDFKGKADHDETERYFAPGEIIFGELAEVAVKAGNASDLAEKKGKGK